MMNERLTLQNLVDLLSDKQNITKKDAETFLRELVDLISETISEKDFVRIKDNGTFKLTKVNSRRSVDVNSGDPIEIPAHYKLSFIPDKVLREGVNKPFEHFESMEVPDDVQFEDKAKAEKRAQAKEIENKIKAERKEEAQAVEAKKEAPKVIIKAESPKEIIVPKEFEEETKLSVVNEFMATGIEEEKEQTKKTIETAPMPPREEKPRVAKKIRQEYEDDDFVDYEFLSTQKKKRNTRIGIAAFLLILLIAGFWAYNKFMVVPDPIPIAQNNSELIITEDESAKVEQPTGESTVAQPTDIPVPATGTVQPAPATTTVVAQQAGEEITVPAGATMRSLGEKYYGHISFWVYIFEENRSKIASPDALFAGMQLVIPPASKYGIDANSKESVEKARKEELKLFKEFAPASVTNE